jgi:hypothetical protein
MNVTTAQKIPYWLCISCLVFGLLACGEETNVDVEEMQTLETELFALHDQLMMDHKELPALKDSLLKVLGKASAIRGDSISKVVSKIDSALTSMQAWVKVDDAGFLEKDTLLAEKKRYLLARREGLITIKRQTDESKQQGNYLLMLVRPASIPSAYRPAN